MTTHTTNILSTRVAAAQNAAQLFWLYGVVPRGQPLPDVPSVSLLEISHGGLSAVVEAVQRSDFTPELLESCLESIEWIAPLARRHNTVLSAVMGSGPVIPARLCSLFTSAQAIEASLAARETHLSAALDRIAGCREWGLRVSCDRRLLEAAIAADLPAPPDGDGASAGLSYILAKKREAQVKDLAEQRLEEIIDEIIDLLEPHTAEICERPIRPVADDSPRAATVLRLASLVQYKTGAKAQGEASDDGAEDNEDASEDAFQRAVVEAAERYRSAGFEFELSGPWVPFSFCADDAPAEDTSPAQGTTEEKRTS